MAITHIYVDPSIDADSGAGTIGDPFGDLEYAIEQTTFDTTNGTQVNIKSSATETLAAALNAAMADTVTTVAWVPSASAPLVFRGYTTTANDGGKFTISGGGSVAVLNNTSQSYVHFIDGRVTNTGANNIISVDNYCSFINLEVDTTTGIGVDCDVGNVIQKCYFHGCTGTYAVGAAGGANVVTHNVIVTGGATYGAGIAGGVFANNIVVINNIGDTGVRSNSGAAAIVNNSFYSSVANTGSGVFVPNGANMSCVINNLFEGFSGAGGLGIDAQEAVSVSGGNAFYNCTTNSSFSETLPFDYGDETLSASPFTDAANGDFSPVNTGSVKEGSQPGTFNTAYP